MRRFLFLLIAWVGIAAPAWADVCLGQYATPGQAMAARNAVAPSGWATFTVAAGSAYDLGYYGCTGLPSGAKYIYYGSLSAPPWTGYQSWAFQSLGCPEGQIANGTGKCVAACQYNSALASDDPLCVPPPANPCLDKPTVDPGGQWRSGLLNQHFCDGQCDVALRPSLATPAEESCFLWETDPDGADPVCVMAKQYNGDQCTSANVPASEDAPTSENTNAAITCPTGYTLNSFNLCVSASTPGTASTSTTPGTAGTPGATTCPVGYSDNGYGQCVANAPTTIGCPEGYSVTASGQCQAPATLQGGSGEGEAEAGTISAAAATGATAINQAGDLMAENLLTIPNRSVDHGWTWGFSNLNLPTANCQPWVIETSGRQISIDPCPVAQKIREIGAYVLYVMTIIGLFNILTGNKPE